MLTFIFFYMVDNWSTKCFILCCNNISGRAVELVALPSFPTIFFDHKIIFLEPYLLFAFLMLFGDKIECRIFCSL